VITYRVELGCNGCSAVWPQNLSMEDLDALHIAKQVLIGSAEAGGWTVQGKAHWCPDCTQQRATQPNGGEV
jgi:hypothetical protein